MFFYKLFRKSLFNLIIQNLYKCHLEEIKVDQNPKPKRKQETGVMTKMVKIRLIFKTKEIVGQMLHRDSQMLLEIMTMTKDTLITY